MTQNQNQDQNQHQNQQIENIFVKSSSFIENAERTIEKSNEAI